MSIFGSIFETIKGAVTDPVCTAFKTQGGFWQLVAFLSEARAKGVVTNRGTCESYARTSGVLANLLEGPLVGGATEKFIGCACEHVFPNDGIGLGEYLLQELAKPHWSNWDDRGGVIKGRVAVVSPVPSVRELYVRGMDDEIWQLSWRQGAGWGGWDRHEGGNKIGADPTAVAATATTRDIFVTGLNKRIYQKHFNGTSWSWLDLGGQVKGSVGAVALPNGAINLYARGMNDEIWENKSSDGRKWTGWALQQGGNKIDASPTVVATTPTTRDIFVRGFDGVVYQKHLVVGAGTAGTWVTVGGEIKGEVGVVSLAPNVIDMYVRGMDDMLYQNWTYDGKNWHGWERFTDGVLASAPAVVVPEIGTKGYPVRDVYARMASGAVGQKFYA